ncbi:MAG: FAD-linked oxidase C-terminal domain-containing protein [Candidatus Margulisiibacteriota bacterium]|jgi:glycolate oxidase
MNILEKLITILGPENVIIDSLILKNYQSDRYLQTKNQVLTAVTPMNESHIAQLLKLANKHKISLTVRAAGTSTTGAATPNKETILVLTEKLNQILEIDLVNKVAVVEPGVITEKLQNKVEALELYYPPDPSSLAECTLGGNVMQNAGGARALKYGVTRNYVLGLEGFWASGQKFKFGGKILKIRQGYDLLHLLIGSEGTLGIITKIYLKLIQKPKYCKNVLVGFNSYQKALTLLQKILASNLVPDTFELMDQFCIQAAEQYLDRKLKLYSKAYFLIQLTADQKSELDNKILLLIEIIKTLQGEYLIAETEKEAQDLWQIRRCLSDALKKISVNKFSQDIVVPIAEIPKYMNYLKRISNDLVKVIGFGHLGDGNIHLNILNLNPENKNWFSEAKKIEKRLIKYALKLGGTISGEHGFGLAKKEYLRLLYSKTEINYLKKIKKIFDPNNILNSGKIF